MRQQAARHLHRSRHRGGDIDMSCAIKNRLAAEIARGVMSHPIKMSAQASCMAKLTASQAAKSVDSENRRNNVACAGEILYTTASAVYVLKFLPNVRRNRARDEKQYRAPRGQRNKSAGITPQAERPLARNGAPRHLPCARRASASMPVSAPA